MCHQVRTDSNSNRAFKVSEKFKERLYQLHTPSELCGWAGIQIQASWVLVHHSICYTILGMIEDSTVYYFSSLLSTSIILVTPKESVWCIWWPCRLHTDKYNSLTKLMSFHCQYDHVNPSLGYFLALHMAFHRVKHQKNLSLTSA